jgi:hypothetical protein
VKKLIVERPQHWKLLAQKMARNTDWATLNVEDDAFWARCAEIAEVDPNWMATYLDKKAREDEVPR